MRNGHLFTFQWLGSEQPYLDHQFVANCSDIVIGCYGGNTLSGADKNEDAALVWNAINDGWKFTMLLDAHTTTQSAELVLDTIQSAKMQTISILAYPLEEVVSSLQRFLVDLFASEVLRAQYRQVSGETACLICVQKKQFLYWLSIGDN